MTEYIVRWHTVTRAENAREAAQDVRARNFQLRASACFFDVQPTDDPLKARWEQVDLTEHDDSLDKPGWEFSQQALYRMAKKMVDQGDDIDAILEMLERPWKWTEVLTQAALDDAYDKVSPTRDEPDLSDDD